MRCLKFNLLLLFCALTISLKGQTLHAIVICNEAVSDEYMEVEKRNVLNHIQMLCDLLEYELNLQYWNSPDCTREKLKTVIDEMEVKPKDVVLTFYCGPGVNDGSTLWPQYLMTTGFEPNWVKMTELKRWVEMKNPRLCIVLSDCCNRRLSTNSSKVEDQANYKDTEMKPLWDGKETSLNAEHYKKLFSVNGCIMSTSSKLGQNSWIDKQGGIYTQMLWRVMSLVGEGHVAPDWESVLNKVYNLCYEMQHPYHEITLNLEQ